MCAKVKLGKNRLAKVLIELVLYKNRNFDLQENNKVFCNFFVGMEPSVAFRLFAEPHGFAPFQMDKQNTFL